GLMGDFQLLNIKILLMARRVGNSLRRLPIKRLKHFGDNVIFKCSVVHF
ncbi:MAG: hypothetical protein ACI8QG_001881, partial [Flavobacteriales bacterium]